MKLTLNVYTDETLKDVKRTAEADRLKIPYRVSIYLIQCLDEVNFDDEMELLKFVTGNVDKIDKIVKATFGISENELDCVDGGELMTMLKELYDWLMEKVKGFNGNELKNSQTAV